MMRSKFPRVACAAALLFLSATAHAADPAATCESSQLKATSKYLSCVLGADSKAAKSGDTSDYSKCSLDAVTKAEDKAGAGVCPSTTDLAALQTYLDQCAQGVATALGGGDLPPDPAVCEAALTSCEADLAACQSATCGNGVLEAGEDCEVDWASMTAFDTGSDCAGEGFAAGSLACGSGCVYDTSGCRNQVCGDGFVDAPEQCDDGNVVNGDGCDSTCQDEALACAVVDNGKGGTYTDNCDGTVTDSTTGLMWEKKLDTPAGFKICTTLGSCPDPHEVSYCYAYSAQNLAPWQFDGPAKTEFLDRLNCQGAYTADCTPFAGHNDWRLPTVMELSGRGTAGVASGGIVGPTSTNSRYIDPVFGDTNLCYLTSSTDPVWVDDVFRVCFDTRSVDTTAKEYCEYARAVRTGP